MATTVFERINGQPAFSWAFEVGGESVLITTRTTDEQVLERCRSAYRALRALGSSFGDDEGSGGYEAGRFVALSHELVRRGLGDEQRRMVSLVNRSLS